MHDGMLIKLFFLEVVFLQKNTTSQIFLRKSWEVVFLTSRVILFRPNLVTLKYIDVEGMRVVTNNRCVAEQIKSDKVENVVTGGSNMEEFRKVGKEQHLKSIVMNGVKIGKVRNIGKLKNSKT